MKRRIFEDIALNGPMPLSRYMNICLSDPEHGYYTNRDPFGAEGDFVTAPEISQMFGELIGIWLISAWENLDSPAKIRLVELGPGRGTLMADCLRSLTLKPQLIQGLQIEMVEMSPVLVTEQQKRLSGAPCSVCWSTTLEECEIPSLIIANEFYDALPVHVLVKTSSGIFERHVVGSGSDSLEFADLPASLPKSTLLEYENLPENTVFELSPERHQITQKISSVIKQHGGGALLVDYGFQQPKTGTTFQALKNHKSVDPLDEPGSSDLTSLVDFTALQKEFRTQGLNVYGPTSQMDFLLNLGVLERAGHLGASANLQTQTALQNAVTRLVSPDEMGTLFKVISATTCHGTLPGFSKET
ncbi:MAG: class I SAM-dependent methyltransferase [Hyphomicrobiales bacterium]